MMNATILLCALLSSVPAEDDPISTLPVREITVFKDGHAFVLQEGEVPVGESGNVVLDNLPQPIMGTFWPYAAESGATLTGVVAGKRAVNVGKQALNMAELLRANVGAAVTLTERSGRESSVIIADVFESADLLLLKTEAGTRVVSLSSVLDVVFHGEGETMLDKEELRDLLTLDIQWDGAPREKARVGMAYLQKGFRWIPHYRVSVDGEGLATIRLQATLINELVDVEDVTTNLVIGVPSFAFKDTLDPIALQQAAAQLSPYFQQNQQTAFALSNAMMTQTARMGEYNHIATPSTGSGSSESDAGTRNEDHFIFTIEHVTLRKGERMIVPVVEFTLPYRDVFTLDVAMVPPPELQQHFNSQQQQNLAQLFHRPKVMHQLRLDNSSEFPLTTAPALILKGDRLVGQGMMTYTPLGCEVDLELTAAVDIPVNKADEELGRTPNDIKWHGYNYDRVDLRGELRLFNRKDTPVVIEVVRHVLGEVDSVDGGGTARKVNVFEDEGLFGRSYHYGWYYGYNVWNRVNGIGRITWTVELEPGESAELGYTWHHHVR